LKTVLRPFSFSCHFERDPAWLVGPPVASSSIGDTINETTDGTKAILSLAYTNGTRGRRNRRRIGKEEQSGFEEDRKTEKRRGIRECGTLDLTCLPIDEHLVMISPRKKKNRRRRTHDTGKRMEQAKRK